MDGHGTLWFPRGEAYNRANDAAMRADTMTAKLLGIDVGTGGTRAVLLDEAGRVLGAATAEHAAMSCPKAGWAEQEPQDWWRAACLAIRECMAKAGARGTEVTGIGVTGQMHGLVLLDARGEVLRPSILWCDQRTAEQCRAITERVGARRLIELTANPALTGFTLPKILWVREHEPDIWSRTRAVLLPKDYVRYRMTGGFATDVADASGTLLFDVVNRRWSGAMLESFGVMVELLPKVFESPEITGWVSKDGAIATGLCEGTPVAAGGGDQSAGALAMGVVRPGEVSATIGTSGVAFAATSRPVLEPEGRIHTFCHAVPGRWHVMGVTQGAGLSLRWFREQFGAGKNGRVQSYDELAAEAATVPAGADGLLWTPYLMGERTPHLDPHARGALVGLTARHTRAHVIRAILEGVAFSLRDTLAIFRGLNLPVKSIRLGGGGARSPVWQQVQADIYGMPVDLAGVDEGPAYGAGLLAGVGTDVWRSLDAACEKAVQVAKRIEPVARTVELMNQRYEEYRKIYPALRQIGHAGHGG